MNKDELEREMERLHPASFGWALACCHRRRDEAEEVLQTTYLKILEGKARFDGRASFKTWLFAVIRRTAAELSRRRVLRVLRLDRALVGRTLVESPTAETEIAYSQLTEHLLRALAKLARRQREVLELVFYHQMTIEQAAQTIGVSLGAARVHYERGKKRLLQELQQQGIQGLETCHE